MSNCYVLFLALQLGLPGDCQLEFVNGGHGIKNPLAIDSQRQATASRDEERATRPPPGRVILIILYPLLLKLRDKSTI